MKKCTLCQLLSDNICHHYCSWQYHELIEAAIRRFIKEDRYLSELDVNERSQTHKLAEYIQHMLPEYNVDCEYNKNLTREKELDFSKIVKSVKEFLNERIQDNREHNSTETIAQLREELAKAKPISDESDLNENKEVYSFLQFSRPGKRNKKYIKRVYPDIIAHLRGTNTNKIVIEAKKESNKDKKARLFDLIKLGLFTEQNGQFCYEAGYFIELPSKSVPGKFEIKFIKDDTVPNSNVFIVKIVSL